jgi:arylsulfatase A-like enzyme/poly(3-hydroxybutyrate) depolymerase
MKFASVFLIIICFVASPGYAQGARVEVPTGNNKHYVKHTFKAEDGTVINYWIMSPEKIDAGHKYPLVLALHGRGGSTMAAAILGSDSMRNSFPCFVIAPASTNGGHWLRPQGISMKKKNTIAMLPAALQAMDLVIKNHPIDADRVYVTGQSMGGAGTFGAMYLRPDAFAAAIPVAGGWDPNDAHKMKHIPIWVFHGDKDNAVPTDYSRNMVAALEKAGGSPKYTEYAGVGHNSWSKAYSAPETWNWLFKQKRIPGERMQAPNILFIMTDQQSAEMLSCAGNRYLHTPALDELAERGVRFELVYSPNPVCIPSRTSMVTGLFPSALDLSRNEDANKLGGDIPQYVLDHTMGKVISNGGYDCVFGGKTHWIKGLNYNTCGFENLTTNYRDVLAEKCAGFLKQEHEDPFLLVASFMNPHDICYHILDMVAEEYHVPKVNPGGMAPRNTVEQAIAEALKAKKDGTFDDLCPPVRANAGFTANVQRGNRGNKHNRPDPDNPQPLDISYYEKEYVEDQMTEKDWRLYSWVYHRLTEDVDRQIGIVLDALKESGLEDNTIVVFTSDHGEMNGAHSMVAKNKFYDESSRVPFLIAGPGVKKGVVDRKHFISASTDLLPTFCDYAGVPIPEGLHGNSIRKIAEGKSPEAWREYVISENIGGRMLRTDGFKYIYYRGGTEVLYDMEKDPGEMDNLAAYPEYRKQMDTYKSQLKQWVEETKDPVAQDYLTQEITKR